MSLCPLLPYLGLDVIPSDNITHSPQGRRRHFVVIVPTEEEELSVQQQHITSALLRTNAAASFPAPDLRVGAVCCV